MRKLLAAVGVVAVAAVLVPSSANAAEGGVVVFTGNARVGNVPGFNWNGAPGDGLCFPGLTATSGGQCLPSGATQATTNGWRFSVPADQNAPVILCSASGTFGGATATGESCSIDSDGDVTANAAGIGPSCGMSAGTSTSSQDINNNGINDDDDALLGNGPDTFFIGANEGTIDTNWITSAGGTIPLTGSYEFGGVSNDFVGLVQARPLDSGACATAPAKNFFVVGVTAGAAA